MALVRPFHITHYSEDLNGVLDKLITPPYDVISPEEQEAFYQSHPLNIIRLVLGKQHETDSVNDDRYTRAASTLRDWIEKGILVSEKEPGLAVYQMQFRLPEGGVNTIDGVVGLVKVDDYGIGKVLPHEKTYKGPKEDQLKLLRSCRSNFTPIHGLFDDEAGEIVQVYGSILNEKPLHETTDQNGSIHRVWIIRDTARISRIIDFLADKSIFIADGHHRYETARGFRAEMENSRDANRGRGDDFVMMYLTAMSHPGLTILPAHRMIKGLEDLDVDGALERLSGSFEIEELCSRNGDREEAERVMFERLRAGAVEGGLFGLAVHGDECLRLLKLRDLASVDTLMDPEIPSSLRALDVTILGELVMGYGFGLDKASCEGRIEYSPLALDALKRAVTGRVQASFILNPTRVDQMRQAAELGHKLPHKSTYFFPKLSSGLVLNVFDIKK